MEACLATALVVVGASPVGGAARVDSVSTLGGALFEMMDSSEDGSVSRLEAYSAGVHIVSSLDQNWDGHLSLSEVSTIPRRFASRSTSEERQQMVDYMRLAFAHLDLDGDNWVNRHEFPWWNGVFFSSVNADQDGLVTWAELEPVLRRLTRVDSAADWPMVDRSRHPRRNSEARSFLPWRPGTSIHLPGVPEPTDAQHPPGFPRASG